MIDLLNNKYEIIVRDCFVYVKYYKKIVDINSSVIKISFNNKNIIVHGNGLIVCALDEYEIVIKGIISSIEFTNE